VSYARRILGWSVATTMTTQLVVDAIAQGIWTRHREGKDLTGLIAHHDHGSQYLSVAYTEHLDAAGTTPPDRCSDAGVPGDYRWASRARAVSCPAALRASSVAVIWWPGVLWAISSSRAGTGTPRSVNSAAARRATSRAFWVTGIDAVEVVDTRSVCTRGVRAVEGRREAVKQRQEVVQRLLGELGVLPGRRIHRQRVQFDHPNQPLL